jgi:hypothetical protein
MRPQIVRQPASAAPKPVPALVRAPAQPRDPREAAQFRQHERPLGTWPALPQRPFGGRTSVAVRIHRDRGSLQALRPRLSPGLPLSWPPTSGVGPRDQCSMHHRHVPRHHARDKYSCSRPVARPCFLGVSRRTHRHASPPRSHP